MRNQSAALAAERIRGAVTSQANQAIAISENNSPLICHPDTLFYSD